jgi:hypothetical protein
MEIIIDESLLISINLGKLSSFTNLNSSAILGWFLPDDIMGFSKNDRKTIKHLSTFLGVLEFIAETSPFLGGESVE